MIDSIPFGSDLAHERDANTIRDHTHVIVFNENKQVLVEKRGHSFSMNGKLGFLSGADVSPEELCLKQLDTEIDETKTSLYSQRFTSAARGKNLIRHRYYLVRTKRNECAYEGQSLIWKNQDELRDSLTQFLELDKSVVSLLIDTWHEHDHKERRRRRRRRKKEVSVQKRKRRAARVRKIGATFLSSLTDVERRTGRTSSTNT